MMILLIRLSMILWWDYWSDSDEPIGQTLVRLVTRLWWDCWWDSDDTTDKTYGWDCWWDFDETMITLWLDSCWECDQSLTPPVYRDAMVPAPSTMTALWWSSILCCCCCCCFVASVTGSTSGLGQHSACFILRRTLELTTAIFPRVSKLGKNNIVYNYRDLMLNIVYGQASVLFWKWDFGLLFGNSWSNSGYLWRWDLFLITLCLGNNTGSHIHHGRLNPLSIKKNLFYNFKNVTPPPIPPPPAPLRSSIFVLYNRVMCQVWNCMEIEYLPVYVPTAEDRDNPTLFAHHVQVCPIRQLLGSWLICRLVDARPYKYDTVGQLDPTTRLVVRLFCHRGQGENHRSEVCLYNTQYRDTA